MTSTIVINGFEYNTCVWTHIITRSPHGYGVIQQESNFCKVRLEGMIRGEWMSYMSESCTQTREIMTTTTCQ